MRIVFIIDWQLYYTIELINALAKEHTVMLITREHNYEISSDINEVSIDDFLNDCLDNKVSYERLRYRRRDLRSFLEITRLYKKIKDFNPDILHLQQTTDWRIFLLAKLFGFSKTVLTMHDVINHPGKHTGLQSFLVKNMQKKVKSIIVHGDFLKKQLMAQSKILKDKIYVIPHGVYDIYKKWDDNQIEEEENTVLFFGRISEYKGIDTLIKAQPLITKEIKNAKVVIAGRGEDFTKYQQLIIDQSRFEIHNRFIPHKEIYKFFRRASIVVLPYREASQSGVVAIAYAFGKPVVVTNTGSLPEAIEDERTGLVVPANNPRLLAAAIIKMLKDINFRRFVSRNMLDKAKTDLSWEHIARLTIKAYL
jgi:glycosyltransferase involved in cell wall biosynthesis